MIVIDVTQRSIFQCVGAAWYNNQRFIQFSFNRIGELVPDRSFKSKWLSVYGEIECCSKRRVRFRIADEFLVIYNIKFFLHFMLKPVWLSNSFIFRYNE